MTFAKVRNEINKMLSNNGIYQMGSVKSQLKDESKILSKTTMDFMKNYKMINDDGLKKETMIGQPIDDVYDLTNFLDELDDIINDTDIDDE